MTALESAHEKSESTMTTGDAILLVEDSAEQATLVRRWLEAAGHADVVHATDGETAATLLGLRPWSLLISDIELPGMDGLEVIRQSREADRWTPTLLITAHESFDYARRAIRNKADDFLTKPLSRQAFLDKVRTLVRTGREQRRLHQHVVLAIGAHPDDVEIGCGGILLRHRRAGDAVIVLTLTGGGKGGVKADRMRESHRAAALMGATLRMTDLPDTSVSEGLDTISVIESAIREYRPTTIYTHSDHDAHQDHRATHRATMVAARGIPNLYCYQSPSSTVDFKPSAFVDIEEDLENKVAVLDAYQSQVQQRPYLIRDLIVATACYWGRFAGYRKVEALEVVRRTE